MTDSAGSWGLWIRQSWGVLRLELVRSFLGRRAILLYMLAAVSTFPFVLRLVAHLLSIGDGTELADDILAFSGVFQVVLRFSVYLGSLWVFMNLIRGDMIDRTLHLYFLTPIRREVLVVAKFVAGLIVTISLFWALLVFAFLCVFAPRGSAFDPVLIGHLLAYLGATALACVGYGTVFLLVGTFVRNMIVPGVALFAWESLNGLLPAVLKKLSVIHYVTSLIPVRPQSSGLEILINPTPWYVSAPGLLVLSMLVLWVAALRVRRLEINYATD